MADNDQPSRLEAATVKAEAGSQIVSDFANLPADQTVATASGNIPTLAGVIGGIQDEGDQAAADVRTKADAQVQAAIGTLVKKAGDSMTGLLILSGDPTSSLGAATKRYVDTGDANTLASSKTYTDQKVAAVPAQTISKYFESAQQTLTAGGLLTIAHGFGIRPKLINAQLVCISDASGYTAGDRIEFNISGFTYHNGSTAFSSGISVYADTANLNVRIASDIPVAILNKSSGGMGNGNINAWRLVLRAAA